jgi:hypothetical protein
MVSDVIAARFHNRIGGIDERFGGFVACLNLR